MDAYREVPTITMGTKVPKQIHQIYLSGNPPPPLSANVQALISQNPRWEHNLYDARGAERFILANYGAPVLDVYRRIDPRYGAARADLFRYLLMYITGGIYLDIKSRFRTSIDDVIEGGEFFVLSQWRNRPGQIHQNFGLHSELSHVPGGEFQQWHIIAVPGHPFLRAVIKRVLLNISRYKPWHAVGKTGVVRLTGPVPYTLSIAPLLDDLPHTRIENEDAIGLEFSIGGDYHHAQVFTQHYSQLRHPVVQLSAPGRLASRAFVALRDAKGKLNRSLLRGNQSEASGH